MGRRSSTKLVTAAFSSVLPLIAGLFMLVEALDHSGIIGAMTDALRRTNVCGQSLVQADARATLAFASNLMNNLATELLAAPRSEKRTPPGPWWTAFLTAVDVAPNLSATGPPATIGVVTMSPALIAAIAMWLIN